MALFGQLGDKCNLKSLAITGLVVLIAAVFPLLGGGVIEAEICDLEFDSENDPEAIIGIVIGLGIAAGLTPKSSPAPDLADFEPNLGQFRSDIQFASSSQTWSLETARGGTAVLRYRTESDRFELVRMTMDGGSSAAFGEGEQLLPGRVNYLLGRDPSRWATGVPRFAKVRYRNVYPDIDAVHSFKNGRIETDFEVSPGADPKRIRVRFDGVDQLSLDPRDSSLVLHVKSKELRWGQTRIFQDLPDGKRHEISGRIRIVDDHTAGFEIDAYDPAHKLVIDPVLNYLTYSGRNGSDGFTRVATDSNGNLYAVGATGDTTFPVSSGAFQNALPTRGRPNLTLTKLSADGSQVLYTTHFGGSGADFGTGIALDAAGNIYVTGVTASLDFPVSAEAYQRTVPETEKMACFVTKLNPAGSAIVYSTYLNGSGKEGCTNIAVDASGAAYVTGSTTSPNYPVTPDAFQTAFRSGGIGATRAFVTKLNRAGSGLEYSTFLGGSGMNLAMSIAVDTTGAAYIAGMTNSAGTFPVTTGAAQATYAGTGGLNDFRVGDAFAAKLTPDGSRLVYATYIGGKNDDFALGIAVDSAGAAYVTGATLSSDFPVTAGAAQTTFGGSGGGHIASGDAFLVKINPAGSAFSYATYLGGSQNERGAGVVVDKDGNAWVSGHTLSRNFPVSQDAAQKTFGGTVVDLSNPGDGFVTQVNATGTRILYSTYVGGSAGDYVSALALSRDGGLLFAGGSSSRNLPATSGAAQPRGGLGEPTLEPFGDGIAGRIGEPLAPRVTLAGVVNQASYAAEAVAPGTVVSISGTNLGPVIGVEGTPDENGKLPTSLAESRVLFDDVAAPLLYTSEKLIVALVPFEMDGKTSAQLVVEHKTDKSAPLTMTVVAAQPGLYTINGSGTGQAVAVNEDSALNSSDAPAMAGTIVKILATGFGQTDPASENGKITPDDATSVPVQPVKALLGETEVEVVAAATAPGKPAGYSWLSIRIPNGLEAGQIPVTVRVGEASSQNGVTIAVAGGDAMPQARRRRR